MEFSQIPQSYHMCIFSAIVKHRSTQNCCPTFMLDLVAQQNCKLKQIDNKTKFIHGEFKEDIYMENERFLENDENILHRNSIKLSAILLPCLILV